jgi:hypothetical protein
MKTSTLETLIWVLIYGGLLGFALGLAVLAGSKTVGAGICITGGVSALAGVVLIYVRSRIKSA